MTSLRWFLFLGMFGVLALLSMLGVTFNLFGRSVAQTPQDQAVQEVVEKVVSNSGEVVPPPPQEALQDLPVGDGSTSESLTKPIEAPELERSAGVVLPELPKDAYIYRAEGKRDPFEPFRRIRASMPATTPTSDLTALERWELDKIKIIAVLWDTKNPRAVVMTPDASTHTVVKGTKIGRNFGVVKDIREGEIVVVEKIFVDGKSKTEIQVIELK